MSSLEYVCHVFYLSLYLWLSLFVSKCIFPPRLLSAHRIEAQSLSNIKLVGPSIVFRKKRFAINYQVNIIALLYLSMDSIGDFAGDLISEKSDIV